MALRCCCSIILSAIIILAATGARAQTATLDSIDVQRVGDELFALRDGSSPTRIALEPRERVLSLGSRGIVGVALTDRRFLVISTRSSGWEEMRLREDDGSSQEIRLAANLVLLVTHGRILAFDAPAGLLTETRLNADETVLDSGANEHTAAVVTNRRAIGFASGSAKPTELKLRIHESFQSLRVLGAAATVRTSDRIIVFSRSSGLWSAQSLRID